jgi:hypothetical protein
MSIDSSSFEHRGSRRIWRYGLSIGVIAASAMTARAFDTSWIAPNQPISATSLKSDLDEINTRLATLESSMAGYPAVDSAEFGDGEWCGPAPVSFNVATDASKLSAAFGRLMTTSEGAFAQNFTMLSLPSPPTSCGSAAGYCHGPITFFLLNPGAAKPITLNVNADNGPSYIYVDGNTGANKFLSLPLSFVTSANVTIPTGPFALSMIVCSSDGPSIDVIVSNKFITGNGLTVDYDRTFHRAGK